MKLRKSFEKWNANATLWKKFTDKFNTHRMYVTYGPCHMDRIIWLIWYESYPIIKQAQHILGCDCKRLFCIRQYVWAETYAVFSFSNHVTNRGWNDEWYWLYLNETVSGFMQWSDNRWSYFKSTRNWTTSYWINKNTVSYHILTSIKSIDRLQF